MLLSCCCSCCNTLQNFGLYLNFRANYGFGDRSFLNHLLVIWWSQDPLFDLKSHSHFYLYIVCVIFGQWYYHLSCKGKFVFLQGEIFVRMGCPHHIDVFHTHFTHSYTSVAFILPKSIIRVTLIVSCHKGCCIKRSMGYMFQMVYVVSLIFQVCDYSHVLSLFTSVSLIPHFAKFWSFLSNLASSNFPELCTSHI